jgi:hypothetical protein
MMEAARTSETSVDIQLTRQYIAEDSELHLYEVFTPVFSLLLQYSISTHLRQSNIDFTVEMLIFSDISSPF